VSAADCIGFYGFSVDKTGHYQVGPTAAGELRSGAIKPEEVAALEALLQDTLHPATEGSSSLNTGGTEEHASLETPTASDDNIFLSKNTADGQKLIRTNGQDLYFTLKSADQAKALYSAVRKLAEAYYAPMPFPDACEEGIGSMKTLIATATSCKLDADCGYFDSNMNPVAPDAEAVLQLDNCARVLPLSVANTEALKATKSKIQELWGQLQQDCGTKLLRSDCTERTGFKLNKAPATCQEGVCKAPSSLAIVPGTPASFL
jgi:hypothetical protein